MKISTKIILTSLLLAILAPAVLSAEAYPPEGWTSDILAAIQESEKTGKEILLNFTGSDWCVWCHRLRDEVFTTKEFKDYAEKNLILVFLDFPQAIKLPDEIIKQNQVMAAVFGVQGYPTIWLMDSTLLPLMKTGYREGGSKAYITHLKEDRPVLDDAVKDEYRKIVGDAIRSNIGSW